MAERGLVGSLLTYIQRSSDRSGSILSFAFVASILLYGIILSLFLLVVLLTNVVLSTILSFLFFSWAFFQEIVSLELVISTTVLPGENATTRWTVATMLFVQTASPKCVSGSCIFEGTGTSLVLGQCASVAVKNAALEGHKTYQLCCPCFTVFGI